MKSILALIEEKQKVYAQSPLFQFMQDQSINPLERLAFVPNSAPFILGFTDLCKYAFYQKQPSSRIQLILNQHAYEDANHWQWYLEDMESLGFNCQLEMNDALFFLWNEETKASRLVTYELYKYITQSTEIEKMIILEALESLANIFLSFTKKITDDLQLKTKREYKYFGGIHVEAEQGHEAHSDDIYEFIQNISITEKEQQSGIELVDKIFALFTQWNQELLTYAQAKNLQSKIKDRQLLTAI